MLWPDSTQPPRLDPGTVHLWAVSLAGTAAERDRLGQLLAEDEVTRASRYLRPLHRDRFVMGRGRLRELLARYIGVPPQALLFDYAAHGKPSLRATPGADSLRFNVSNTADVAVVAVAQELDLGVDVEQVRHLEDARALAHRFFAAAERAALDSLPAAELDAAFFRCWTRKEAVLKALGSGLAWPLNQFAVSLAVDAPRVESFQGPTSDDAPWRLLHLVPAEGYVGALATRGAPVKVHTWSFAG